MILYDYLLVCEISTVGTLALICSRASAAVLYLCHMHYTQTHSTNISISLFNDHSYLYDYILF